MLILQENSMQPLRRTGEKALKILIFCKITGGEDIASSPPKII
jgi:hypothetical protein